MVITYYGAQYYKLQRGDVTIAINPVAKDSKYKSSRFGSDVALITLNHIDFNGVENLAYGGKEPFVVSGPGEYEVNKIFIKGYGVETSYAEKTYINTIYTFIFDSMNVCFMGTLADAKDITNEVKGKIGPVDILFVPVGGEGMISTTEIYALANKLDSKIIIPTQYEDDKKALASFIEESGSKADAPAEKLTIKIKDLEEIENSKVVVLKSNG